MSGKMVTDVVPSWSGFSVCRNWSLFRNLVKSGSMSVIARVVSQLLRRRCELWSFYRATLYRRLSAVYAVALCVCVLHNKSPTNRSVRFAVHFIVDLLWTCCVFVGDLLCNRSQNKSTRNRTSRVWLRDSSILTPKILIKFELCHPQ